MRSETLRAALHDRPLLADGAMGTQLMQAGLRAGECAELWNVDALARVAAVHRAYVDAGAELVLTNTFGGSSATLERHGLAARAAELNRAGAALAREAVGRRAWVLGDIGPCGEFLEPLGALSRGDAEAMFAEQAAALAEGGADGLIVETMTDPQELAAAVRAADRTGLPVLASFAFDAAGETDFRTMMGAAPEDAVRAAVEAGAEVVGANCGTALDLEAYARLAEALLAAGDGVPVILQPNAGRPMLIDGRETFAVTPAQMGAAVASLVKAGVRVVGGCCGSTPAHVRAMAEALATSCPQGET
ncbi:MAG: homocysteine S-methyltransferase family protein [Phycisphaeraceae bacterium]